MAAVADPTVGEAVLAAVVVVGPSPTAAGYTAVPKRAAALATVRPAPVVRNCRVPAVAHLVPRWTLVGRRRPGILGG